MNLMFVVGGALLLAVGALVGRYWAPDKRPLRRAAKEGQAYARGLVELLDGKRDAAIEQLTSALKSNANTVEAYFALGALFRDRGEYERAVRVHQTILVRRDVDKSTKLRVHFQLALDFLEAGFPARAIKALEFVLVHDKKHVNALAKLASLYQDVGMWERAAGISKRLEKLGSTDHGPSLLAHLWAQHAMDLMATGELRTAYKAIKRAVAAEADATHVLFVLGEYQSKKSNPSGAVRAWQRAVENNPDLVSFFFARIESAMFELNKLDQLGQWLAGQIERHPRNVHLRLAQARFDAKRVPDRALRQLVRLLGEHPNLLPARREAAHLVLEKGDPEPIRDAFRELLAVLDRADRGYRCTACGTAEPDIFWRCGSCGKWGSASVAWGRRSSERVRS